MPCCVFYDTYISEHGTFNKIYTGGQQFLIYGRTIDYRKRIVWDVHTESHSAGAPSKRIDGRLWKENRRLLS